MNTVELVNKIVKKYYGSTFYMLACRKSKPIQYICVVEANMLVDSAMRIRMQELVINRLPFRLQASGEIAVNLIADFKILTISEWNDKYSMFPLERCRD